MADDLRGFVAVSMHPLPRTTLREIVARYGRGLGNDPRRTEALLKDLCPAHKRETFVLVSAVRERVPADLLSSKDSTPHEVLLARLSRRMADDLALADDVARWAVESWALALDIISADQLKAAASGGSGGTVVDGAARGALVSPPIPPPVPFVSPPVSPPTPYTSPPSPQMGPGYPGSTPTIIVAQSGGGQFTTIGEAIRVARTGFRIVVRAGVYRESVPLYQQIELVGDGAEQVTIESVGLPCIVMQTESALVRGFSLQHRAAYGGHPAFGVDVPGGRLVLEDCTITSDSAAPWSAAVFVHGPLADPAFRRCTVRGAACMGVLVSEQARGLLEDCDISGNGTAGADPGLMTLFGGNPTVQRCRIVGGAGPGIVAGDRGQGTFDECDIAGNALSGVLTSQSGNPHLRRCQIHDGAANGIWATAGGRGVFEDCDLHGHALAEVAMTQGGNPILRRCRIHNGRNAGIFAAEGGWGTVEDCDVYANALAGVEITAGGNPLIRRTRIRDAAAHNGVLVWGNGQGVIEDSEIAGNGLAGIEIREGGAPVLRRTRVNRNGREAVWVHSYGAGSVESCDLTANPLGPWRIDPGCLVRRTNNRE